LIIIVIGARKKMKKSGRVAIYVLLVIIFFLTIPEIVVRVLTPEQFARLSDFTSFGGLFSHILSLLIFLGVASILLGVLAIFVTKKIFRHVTRYKS
jgi:Kef-type K+ transport system membrane component KefB